MPLTVYSDHCQIVLSLICERIVCNNQVQGKLMKKIYPLTPVTKTTKWNTNSKEIYVQHNMEQ